MKMWVQYLLVSIGAISIAAVNIPLQNPIIPEERQSLPIYYESDEVDKERYLVPHDPHTPVEVIRDTVPTPATYLLPPSPDKQNEYFVKPTEPGEQTEWYPIAASPEKQQEINTQQEVRQEPNEARTNLRTGKVLHRGQVITVPSRNLLPPRENAQDDFVVLSLSPELELPLEEIDHTLNQHGNIELPVLRPPLERPFPVHFRVNPQSPVPYIKPPVHLPQEFKNPTRLYPKKYVNDFKPIPIPISQYEEKSEDDLPTAKPQSQDTSVKSELPRPLKGKKNHLHEESQRKRKHQKDTAKPAAADGNINEKVSPAEQEVSESVHRHPGNHIHPTHSRKDSYKHKPENKSKGERTEFRMHGMKGPNSYQFGYDTGKGKNRQFRYEERDNDGHVRGHYGYVDRFGKLRVVNYDADPEHGFRAEAPVVKE